MNHAPKTEYDKRYGQSDADVLRETRERVEEDARALNSGKRKTPVDRGPVSDRSRDSEEAKSGSGSGAKRARLISALPRRALYSRRAT